MQQPNVICLAIDRLHAGYLGAYGNTWTSTPALDRLAAQSFVFHRAIIDSPDLEILYRSLWLGSHAVCPPALAQQQESLPAIFSRSGWHTALLTDERLVADHSLADAFLQRVLVDIHQVELDAPEADALKSAHQIEETQAAKFFAAAEQYIETARPPFFLWLHTGTLGHIWDAPLEFRRQFADEDDPTPSDSADVPERILPEGFDPDELLTYTHAYAGQLSLIDELIDSLLKTIDGETSRDNTWLFLFSTRGLPLGEHRRVGPNAEELYAELVHVPLMIRCPAGGAIFGRSQRLVQPADWSATILDSCGLNHVWNSVENAGPLLERVIPAGCGHSFLPLVRGEQVVGFDRACSIALDQQLFTTPAWSLRLSNRHADIRADDSARHSAGNHLERAELFVKPDDWFEVNDVSDRCPDVVEKMRAALTDFTQARLTGQQSVLAKLPDELFFSLD